MPARSPEEICRLFQQYMAEGDIDSVLSVYDTEAVFLSQSRELKKGGEALRQELAPFAAMKATFDFNIKEIIQSGDIALMHRMECVLATPNVRVCDRGGPPSGGRHMALAHRRPLHRRQADRLFSKAIKTVSLKENWVELAHKPRR